MPQTVSRSGTAPTANTTETIKWDKCPSCRSLVYLERLDDNRKVCPECSHHFRLALAERLEQLLDAGSFTPHDADLEPVDVLGFEDSKPYSRRLADARAKTGATEAVRYGSATVGGHPVVVAALDFAFMGGSVSGVAGELIARAARMARSSRTPLLIVSASGGARMQEGAISLMQLAKTSQEIERLHRSGVLSLNVNTNPTYGGATASFAMLGDIVIAEPGTHIGFAGPAVIKQTIRQDLPEGFQTAEFLHEHGLIDMVVPRSNLPGTVEQLLALHAETTDTPGFDVDDAEPDYITDPESLHKRAAAETVQLAREAGRPTTLDYLTGSFDQFVELHGDRSQADDPAIVGGLAELDGRTIVALGHQKGRETSERVARNFGMPEPAGYHKAHRLMDYAAKFGFPLVTFVDTPGAFPGLQAEQHGQGYAIARSMMRMSALPVPVVVIVSGEGGSGGALGIGVGNRVLMLENAYFSVISPEGCSTILWGSADSAATAAEALRIAGPDLLRLGVLDGVVPEPEGGAHADPLGTIDRVRASLRSALGQLAPYSSDSLVEQRYARFAKFGDPYQQPLPEGDSRDQ